MERSTLRLLLSCFPSCHRCVWQVYVGLPSSAPGLQHSLQWSRSPGQHLWDQRGRTVWSGSSAQQFQRLWASWCHAAGVCWVSSHTCAPMTLSANPAASQSAHVINQAINPLNLLYAFYFEARFPLSEASDSIWIKKKKVNNVNQLPTNLKRDFLEI